MNLSNDQKKIFSENGMLVIKNFYTASEVAEVQAGIYNVINYVVRKYNFENNRIPFSPDNFDDGFNLYLNRDRSFASLVYDQVKQIPAFLNLMSDTRHIKVFKQLREHSFPLVAGGGYGIRIDHPMEEKYKVYWHQEYPSQLRSINGIVFWSPLVDMKPELGPVKFLPGSHLEGTLPVYQDFGNDGTRSGAYTLRIAAESALLDKYEMNSPILEIGDVVCLDFLTVHASGSNTSTRSRWSMQYRYFDMNDEIGTSHGWKGSYASGVNFSDIHPELLTTNE